MFILFYRKNTPMCEEVSYDLDQLGVSFKKELFQFENSNDVIVVVREHGKGKVVCACKVLMDYRSYKIDKLNYTKQLGLIFCLEWLRTSIIMENLKLFESDNSEIRIFWNKKLLKDNIIEQIAKLVDLHPEKKDYYTIDKTNYLCYSGNNIDLKKDQNTKKPFDQNSLFNNNNGFNNVGFGNNNINQQKDPFKTSFGLGGLGGLGNQEANPELKFGTNIMGDKQEVKPPDLKFGTGILPPVLADTKKQSEELKKDDNALFGGNEIPSLFAKPSGVKDLKI